MQPQVVAAIDLDQPAPVNDTNCSISPQHPIPPCTKYLVPAQASRLLFLLILSMAP